MSSLSPAFTASLQLRDVFSMLLMHISDIGTNFPFLLHNQPWAALTAAPNEAESVKQAKTKLSRIDKVVEQQGLSMVYLCLDKKMKSMIFLFLKKLKVNNIQYHSFNSRFWPPTQNSGYTPDYLLKVFCHVILYICSDTWKVWHFPRFWLQPENELIVKMLVNI